MAERVSRWLRGNVYAAPSGSYVRIATEMWYGNLRFETYITKAQAKELRDRLDWIIAKPHARRGCGGRHPEGDNAMSANTPIDQHGLDDEFPLLYEMATRYDFAERLGGCTDPLLAEVDAAMRELWTARHTEISRVRGVATRSAGPEATDA